jgi:hypothetical protein
MKKPTTKTSRPALEEDSQQRHILHPKIWPIKEDQTHSSRLLEKKFNFFLKRDQLRLLLITTTSIFNNVLDDHLLEEEIFRL